MKTKFRNWKSEIDDFTVPVRFRFPLSAFRFSS
jgi:hypothetical protein